MKDEKASHRRGLFLIYALLCLKLYIPQGIFGENKGVMASNAQAGLNRPEKSSGFGSSHTTTSGTVKHARRRLLNFEFETAVIRRHKGLNHDDHANELGRLLRLLDEL